MEISKFSHSWFGLAAALVVGVWSVPAAADQCSEDGDCPKGFTCETSVGFACPEIDCADGEECDKPADCMTEEVRYCASIDCSADSDCAEGMLCQTVTSEECSGSGGGTAMPGAPGSEGDAEPAPDAPDSDGADPAPEPAPVECTTSERNYCVYRYELPCEAASDCGSGFTCETRDSCVCTSPDPGDTPDGDGSDSSPGDDADLPAPPPDDPGADGEADDAEDGVDDCGCTDDPGPGYCQLEVTECAADADCPSGMTCQDNLEASCSSTPDGGTECVSDPEKLCMPPYSGSVPVYGYDVEEDRGDSGGGEGDPTDPANPDPPATDDNEVDEDLAADGSSQTSSAGGGCAVGSGSALPASSWASLVLLLGAAATRRRRRA